MFDYVILWIVILVFVLVVVKFFKGMVLKVIRLAVFLLGIEVGWDSGGKCLLFGISWLFNSVIVFFCIVIFYK